MLQWCVHVSVEIVYIQMLCHALKLRYLVVEFQNLGVDLLSQASLESVSRGCSNRPHWMIYLILDLHPKIFLNSDASIFRNLIGTHEASGGIKPRCTASLRAVALRSSPS